MRFHTVQTRLVETVFADKRSPRPFSGRRPPTLRDTLNVAERRTRIMLHSQLLIAALRAETTKFGFGSSRSWIILIARDTYLRHRRETTRDGCEPRALRRGFECWFQSICPRLASHNISVPRGCCTSNNSPRNDPRERAKRVDKLQSRPAISDNLHRFSVIRTMRRPIFKPIAHPIFFLDIKLLKAGFVSPKRYHKHYVFRRIRFSHHIKDDILLPYKLCFSNGNTISFTRNIVS